MELLNKENKQKSVKVLTFNVWGLPDRITDLKSELKKHNPVFGKTGNPCRHTRIQMIAETIIEDGTYDVLCFQEVWKQQDRDHLRQSLAEAGWNYSFDCASGLFSSSGLLLISRFPILEYHFQRFDLLGSILRPDHGDYHASKGIVWARLDLGDDVSIIVATTHVSARQFCGCYRLTQVWEIHHLLRLLTQAELSNHKNFPLVVFCGDINVQSSQPEYSLLTHPGRMIDVLAYLNQPEENTIPDYISGFRTKRLDYFFFSSALDRSVAWIPEEQKTVFKHEERFYSDHYGVSAVFSLQPNPTPSPQVFETQKDLKIINDVLTRVEKGLEKRRSQQTHHYYRAVVSLFLIMCMIFVDYWFFPSEFYFHRTYLDNFLLVHILIELALAIFIVRPEISSLKRFVQEISHTQIVLSNLDKF